MGILLNGVMTMTLNMSSLVSSVGIVDVTWSVIRDISSILIIFFLLFTAIEIIIQKTDSKVQHLIIMVVVAGILINFSLFFTKVVVDASNLVSLAFYRAIAPNAANFDFSQPGSSNYLSNAFTSGGLSDEIMHGLGIQSLYQSTSQLAASTTNIVTNPGQTTTSGASTLSIIGSGIGSFILMMITALDFLAASFLFAARIGILIVLMAFSPFYFIGMIIPNVKKKISDKWMDHLLNQCLIMPIYMLFMYVALRVITNPTFKAFVNPAAGTNIGSGAVATSTVGLIMNYVIGIILVTIPLMAAMEYASFGKDLANKAKGRLRSWVGEVTGTAVGSVAGGMIRSRMMNNLHASNPHIASVIHGGLSNVADSTGYTKWSEKRQKSTEKTHKNIQKMLGDVHRADYNSDAEFEAAQRQRLTLQQQRTQNLKNSPISKILGIHRVASDLEDENKKTRDKLDLKQHSRRVKEIDEQIKEDPTKPPLAAEVKAELEQEKKDLLGKVEEIKKRQDDENLKGLKKLMDEANKKKEPEPDATKPSGGSPPAKK